MDDKKIKAILKFYFKVNASKTKDPESLHKQIMLIKDRLCKRYNINPDGLGIYIGTINDDYIKGIERLELTFIFKQGNFYKPK